jgi:hypothetical protein
MPTHAAGQVGLLSSFGTTWHEAYVHRVLLSSNQGMAGYVHARLHLQSSWQAATDKQAGSVSVRSI